MKQLDIFSYEKDAKKEPLIETLNLLRDKYGENIIDLATEKTTKSNHQADAISETSFSKDFLIFFRKSK